MGDLISSINAVARLSGDSSREEAADDTPRGDRSLQNEQTTASVGASTLSSASAFAAQVIGQSNRKRGLKAGPPVLEEAKSAYLETEFSGANERRARVGRVTRTDV